MQQAGYGSQFLDQADTHEQSPGQSDAALRFGICPGQLSQAQTDGKDLDFKLANMQAKGQGMHQDEPKGVLSAGALAPETAGYSSRGSPRAAATAGWA